MKKIKAGLRLLFLSLFVLLAAFGVGIIGAIFNNREHYQNNEVKIEVVDKKKDDESEDESKDQE